MFGYNKEVSNLIARKIGYGKEIVIKLLNKDKYCIVKGIEGNKFYCDKLPKQDMTFDVFDIIVDFLKANGGKAIKGCGRNKKDKVGFGKCTKDTIMYTVAKSYYNRCDGESTFDPIFVLSAILEWVGIAKNCRGYIQLKNYK